MNSMRCGSSAKWVRVWLCVALAMHGLLLGPLARAQDRPDVAAMIHDTQKMSRSPHQLTLVWWLPEQYWRASMESGKSLSQAQMDQILRIIGSYTIIAVVDARVGAFGGMTYESGEALRKETRISDEQGHTYAPLADDQIGPDVRNLLTVLKPIIANIIGPLGQNMYFLAFPAQNARGRYFADPTKNGMLTVDVGQKSFRYRLPLGSFLPPMYDEVTGERFPGNYRYNPFSGKALSATPPSRVSGNSR